MLWSTLVYRHIPRQARRLSKPKNPGRERVAALAPACRLAAVQPRGTHRTAPAWTWSPVIEFSCLICWTTCRVSASGSLASARDHRLCPGSTVTLDRYRPGDAGPDRVACAAVASPTDSAPIRSADTPVTAMRPRRVRRGCGSVRGVRIGLSLTATGP